ncbi:hypothetical protein D3C81_2090270 [compost metagenome]
MEKNSPSMMSMLTWSTALISPKVRDTWVNWTARGIGGSRLKLGALCVPFATAGRSYRNRAAPVPSGDKALRPGASARP